MSIFSTANVAPNKAFRPIKERLVEINQILAWERLLGISISMRGQKSVKFRNTLRDDEGAGAYLFLKRNGIFYLQDYPDHRFHDKNLVDIICMMRNLSPLNAMDQLDGYIPKVSHSKMEKLHEIANTDFVFELRFDGRPWDSQDMLKWDPLKVRLDALKEELWTPLRRFAINSHAAPDRFQIFIPAIGYAIDVFGKHKVYCISDDAPKFLSTTKKQVVGGRSRLDYNKPLFINKSAKDHVVMVCQHFNSRWIVNSESDRPSDKWLIKAASLFPKIYFLYDNDEHGIMYSTKWSEYANSLTGTKKFNKLWLPEGHEKDPSDWILKHGDLGIIYQLTQEKPF